METAIDQAGQGDQACTHSCTAALWQGRLFIATLLQSAEAAAHNGPAPQGSDCTRRGGA